MAAIKPRRFLPVSPSSWAYKECPNLLVLPVSFPQFSAARLCESEVVVSSLPTNLGDVSGKARLFRVSFLCLFVLSRWGASHRHLRLPPWVPDRRILPRLHLAVRRNFNGEQHREAHVFAETTIEFPSRRRSPWSASRSPWTTGARSSSSTLHVLPPAVIASWRA
jgi:hypothetical protein